MTKTETNTTAAKLAIVTGGSRGLGRSMVVNLAARGVDTLFTYNSNRAEADKVVALAKEAGRTAIALQLDTGKVGTFDAFVDAATKAMTDLGVSKFDYLVNNAGIGHHNAFSKITEAELDHVYDVDFKGVFFLTQKLLPLINDGGSIVNISTGLTRFTTPDTIPYAAMKGALEVFTRYLAKELGPRGITVNTIAPGAIETDFSGGMVRDNPPRSTRWSHPSPRWDDPACPKTSARWSRHSYPTRTAGSPDRGLRFPAEWFCRESA